MPIATTTWHVIRSDLAVGILIKRDGVRSVHDDHGCLSIGTGTVAAGRLRWIAWKLAGLYEGIEADMRRLLAMLPQRDLEVVIQFFEGSSALRTRTAAAYALSGCR